MLCNIQPYSPLFSFTFCCRIIAVAISTLSRGGVYVCTYKMVDAAINVFTSLFPVILLNPRKKLRRHAFYLSTAHFTHYCYLINVNVQEDVLYGSCCWLKPSPKGLVVCVVVADYDKLYLILNKPYLAHDMHEMQFRKKMQFTWIVHVFVRLLA